MRTTAVEPPTYDLPPSLQPVESKCVSAFRQSGPCDFTSEIAAVLIVFECFQSVVNARPINGTDWPGELYRNLLSMINFASYKWLVRSFDTRDADRPTWPKEFADFNNFSATLRAQLKQLKQLKSEADAAWAEYEAQRWPEMKPQ